MNFNLKKVDYIALCPGYTDRLIYNDIKTLLISDKNYLSKVYRFDEPIELRFWSYLYMDETEREKGVTIEEYCRDNDEYLGDHDQMAVPILISNYRNLILEEEGVEFMNTFFPDYEKKFYGSIVFAPVKGETLEMVDWLNLARAINIDFCGCYNPSYPNEIELLCVNGKTVLVVDFDCESG